ncbi:chemotaxis protein CheW [Caldanaerobacter subterraneus]|uniref:Chemotaxis protein CheW n=1 Tax=Caldanaerobacter subterraneus TaxID=911092 RepID=A0A7Y2L7B1_9THEO|nr:chemotaxis protein CheW [Caldanaerobacter subterraneus]NNG67107.1 chemotaxis protein CheW [Caldanaerobacter subterraneus]
MPKKIVVFSLAEELYGLDIFDVHEVVKDVSITKIPETPEFIEGIINLRGKIIPVIDLKKRFGIGKRGKSKDSRIIIVEILGQKAGLIVDAVHEVITVDENSIEPPPPVTTIDTAFVEGIAKTDDKMIIIIKLHFLFKANEKEMLLNASSEGTKERS